MKYNIRGEKMVVTEAIDDYVKNKLGKLDKYFKDSEVKAIVNLKTRSKYQIIEVTIPTNKFVLRGEEEHEDLYAAIDLVVDKLERQIRKNKTRLNKQNVNDKYIAFNFDYEVAENEITNDKIVKRKKLEMKPMDEEEALLEMDLLGHSFFIYRDVDTDRISVLYRRKDGNVGIIETK